MTTTTARVVLTTTDSADEAERLARALVDARLAACVQIGGPVRSVFRWEGAVSVEPEWQLWLKTDASRVDDLTARLVAEHPTTCRRCSSCPSSAGTGRT